MLRAMRRAQRRVEVGKSLHAGVADDVTAGHRVGVPWWREAA
jgi:hypothetical protein